MYFVYKKSKDTTFKHDKLYLERSDVCTWGAGTYLTAPDTIVSGIVFSSCVRIWHACSGNLIWFFRRGGCQEVRFRQEAQEVPTSM